MASFTDSDISRFSRSSRLIPTRYFPLSILSLKLAMRERGVRLAKDLQCLFDRLQSRDQFLIGQALDPGIGVDQLFSFG